MLQEGKDVPPIRRSSGFTGPFLFGTADKLLDATADLSAFAPIVILRLRNMTAIDATGLHALEGLSDRLKKSDRTLAVSVRRPGHQPAKFLDQAEFRERVGAGEHPASPVQAALTRAAEIWARGPGRAPERRLREPLR